MTISKNIIIGESIAYKAQKILNAIRKNKFCKDVIWYAVITAPEDENLMYIIDGIEFGLPFYNNSSLRLLGLAGSGKEAREIVLKLVQTGYTHNDIHNMKHFLETF